MTQYAAQLYGAGQPDEAAEHGDADEEEVDIEAEIKKELEGIRKPTTKPLFASVKMNTQCCKPRSHCKR